MGVKGAVVEGSEGNEEHVIGNWRKGGSCYRVAESLAEFFLQLWGKQGW